ncbi:CDP-glycerol glycerophosphotransferase family protein [Dellaglioa algida]|uniref:CDP-glycerol glycerophosphotransferase family protein n=1 Tax=Dellaglioa algida TaxID=105612 RepID=UPI0024C47F31|nr:CDP-glycerol glycerophosphotransferase family protein [Dellaglioa algida]MDK1724757.1 CDP-glycerol glycerophosphotransferase family protein [Dellaglioa algida]MDK1738703.1 CDP-glycerol glycerophosphotransferase family protein [Dellaglioa algida]
MLKLWLYNFSGIIPKNLNSTVFGAWNGLKLSDNSMYLLDYIVSNNSNPKLKLYWVGESELKNQVITRYNGKVKFLKKNSVYSLYILLSSKFIFTSNGMIDFWRYNLYKNAELVLLWHGFPVKKIGSDAGHFLPDRAPYTEHYKYYISNSNLMSERMTSAYNISKENGEQLIEFGQPRVDILFDLSNIKTLRSKIFKELKIPDKAKLITYLPTFRDNSDKVFSFESLGQDFFNKLKEKNIYIIEKQHFVRSDKHSKKNLNVDGLILIDDEIDTQELLSVTDVLVTDYSSVYVDFMSLHRPIFHYIYDGDDYLKNDRGIYNENFKNEIGGKVIFELTELKDSLLNLNELEDSKVREEHYEIMANKQFENASEKILDYLNYPIIK